MTSRPHTYRPRARIKPDYAPPDLTWTGSLIHDGATTEGLIVDRHGWQLRLTARANVADGLSISVQVAQTGAVLGPWSDDDLRTSMEAPGAAGRMLGSLRYLGGNHWSGTLTAERGKIALDGRTSEPGVIVLRGRG